MEASSPETNRKARSVREFELEHVASRRLCWWQEASLVPYPTFDDPEQLFEYERSKAEQLFNRELGGLLGHPPRIHDLPVYPPGEEGLLIAVERLVSGFIEGVACAQADLVLDLGLHPSEAIRTFDSFIKNLLAETKLQKWAFLLSRLNLSDHLDKFDALAELVVASARQPLQEILAELTIAHLRDGMPISPAAIPQIEQDGGSCHAELVDQLKLHCKRNGIKLETWGSERGVGRSQFFEWLGGNSKGKVSTKTCDILTEAARRYIKEANGIGLNRT